MRVRNPDKSNEEKKYSGFQRGSQSVLCGDYPYLTAEAAVLRCALDASKERREKRKKPFSAFSVCSAVKGNGVEKPAFELVGNHQVCAADSMPTSSFALRAAPAASSA